MNKLNTANWNKREKTNVQNQSQGNDAVDKSLKAL